ncbi:MAG: erythromycin esterase family protein, partial [Pseudobdellovibrionaceae bacterium]
PVQNLLVPEAMPDSYESHFHSCVSAVGAENYFLIFDEQARLSTLADWKGHRAIGVVYDPASERRGNYVPTSLSRRYDAFVFIDETQALLPFENRIEKQEIPETFPTGM